MKTTPIKTKEEIMYPKSFIVWLISQSDYEFMGYCKTRERLEWYEQYSVSNTISFDEMFKQWEKINKNKLIQ